MFRSNVPPDNLPEGWCAKQLCDVAAIHGGGRLGLTKADYVKDGVRAYSAAGPDGFVAQQESAEPSIILSSIGARCGKSFLTDGPWATLANTQVITPNRNVAEASFLIGLLDDETYWNRSGSAQPFIKPSDVKAAWVPIPPLDEQRRIAEVLRSVDETIAANAALLDGVRAAKQGTMEAVLSGGFDEVRLETLLADTRYPMRSGPFGSALLKSELQPEGIPFLGIDNVHVERFVPVYRRFISDEKYRELARYTVYPGDVMVTIMGTVGRCCVVPPDVGTAISSKHVWTLTLDHERYSPALLAWQINHSPNVLAQLQGSAQGGIMSAISSGTLRDLLVPLPSPDEVREIEAVLLSFNDQIAALEAEQDAAHTLKLALMSDLLSGRVRVPA